MKSSSVDVAHLVLLASLFIVSCVCTPLQVVSVDGTCRGASQIGSYVSSQPISQTGNSCPVIGLIDCSSEGNGCAIFNSVLETTFDTNSRGNNLAIRNCPSHFVSPITNPPLCNTIRIMFGHEWPSSVSIHCIRQYVLFEILREQSGRLLWISFEWHLHAYICERCDWDAHWLWSDISSRLKKTASRSNINSKDSFSSQLWSRVSRWRRWDIERNRWSSFTNMGRLFIRRTGNCLLLWTQISCKILSPSLHHFSTKFDSLLLNRFGL